MKKTKERSLKAKIVLRALLLAFLLFWIVALVIAAIGKVVEQIEYSDINDGSWSLGRDYERGEYDALVTDLGYYAKDDAAREKYALYLECAAGYEAYIRCLECRAAAENTGDDSFLAEAAAQYDTLAALQETAQHDTNRTVFARFLAALDEASAPAADTPAAP